MLVQLSIRDIVLIDRLDLDFPARPDRAHRRDRRRQIDPARRASRWRSAARGDGALVRHGEAQGQVTAVFDLPPRIPRARCCAANDIADDGDLILRRVQCADGRTRAFVNDQPVSVQAAARRSARALVEIHGQHDDRALVDPSAHRALLDAFGGLDDEARACRAAHRDAGARRERRWPSARAAHRGGARARPTILAPCASTS